MNYIQTEIDGVWLIEPNVYSDERGYFMEAFKKEEFEAKIGPVDFVQDNESKSSFGVLRGLHYQKGEYSQAKLERKGAGCCCRFAPVVTDFWKTCQRIAQ